MSTERATDEDRGRDFRTTRSVSFRRRFVAGAHSAMHRSGLGLAYRALSRVAGATILMYHSVPEESVGSFIDPANSVQPALFDAQMEMLARCRRVISMTDLVAGVERGETQPAGTVVITFDDGYLDNLTVAAPILARHRLPATLYLATGYVSREEPQWVDQIYSAFRFRTGNELELECGPIQTLADESSTLTAYRGACGRLLPATMDDRRRVLNSIKEQLAPSRNPPKITLGWEDVRQLAARYPAIEIGVHTDDHIDLTSVSIDEAERQVRASIDRVEKETGRRPVHFSFPYGRNNEALRGIVRSAGLRSAIGAGRIALITGKADPYALSRIEAPRSRGLFAFYTSGAYPGLSQLLLRRA